MSKMHEDEIELSLCEVKEMVDEQFPQWSNYGIQKVKSQGTVNTIYRLGERYSIRLPKIYSGVQQIEKENKWLSLLSKELPLKIPKSIKLGKSCEKYPWKWAVYDWIEGERVNKGNLKNIPRNISLLTDFIKALQKIETTQELTPEDHNYHRGEPLINRDKKTRETLYKLKDVLNLEIAEKVWEEALNCPILDKEIKWIHGDLQSGNIIANKGEIISIIDFGALGVGDIACDLMPAWNLFNLQEREVFRNNLPVSELTWKRGRGWALTVAIVAFEYYIDTNPELAKISSYTIKEIEKEYGC